MNKFYILGIFCVLFFIVNLNGQVSFTVDTTDGCEPLTVTFTNTSSTGELYYWDFGNGDDTIADNVVYTFWGKGQWEVRMEAFDTTGSMGDPNNWTYLGEFRENITTWGTWWGGAVSDSVCPGGLVYYRYGGNAQSFLWDFGDGNTSMVPEAEHTYDSAGSYNVVFYATHSCGVDTHYSTIFVDSAAFPDSRFWTNPEDGINCPTDNYQFQFDGAGSPMDQYVWDFGDGSPTQNGESVNYSYADTGTYIVEMTMTNGCGNSRSAKDTVLVQNSKSWGNIGLWVEESCPGDFVMPRFWSDNGEPSFSSYAWDFGDGFLDSTNSPLHAYADTGSYNITVNVMNGCGMDTTLNYTVTIGDSVIPGLNDGFGTPDEGAGNCPGDSIIFYSVTAASVYWDFGDGNFGYATDSLLITDQGSSFYVVLTKHAYTDTGTYVAKITVTNSCGLSNTDSLEVIVTNSGGSNADFVIESPANGPNYFACESVKFISLGGSTFIWDFGDGSPEVTTTEGNYEHSYDNPGSYLITLTGVSGCGDTSYAYSSIIIDEMEFSFSVTPSTCIDGSDGAIDLTIVKGIGGSKGFTWAPFGPSSEDISDIPPGQYTVAVVDSNSCWAYDTVDVSYIYDIELVMNATDASCGTSDAKAWVTATGGMTDYAYFWYADSSTLDTAYNLSSGVQSVLVTDSAGCTETGEVNINTLTPPTVDAGNDTLICEGSSITLSGTGPNLEFFNWNNGVTNGVPVTVNSETLFTFSGTDSSGCTGSDTIRVYIQERPLVDANNNNPITNSDYPATFDTYGSTLCGGEAVQLNGYVENATGLIWSSTYYIYDLNVGGYVGPFTAPSSVFVGTVTDEDPLYVPDTAQIPYLNAGTLEAWTLVYLKATSTGNGICPAAADSFAQFYLYAEPNIRAQYDFTVCSEEYPSVDLSTTSYAFAVDFDQYCWSDLGGSGMFDTTCSSSKNNTYTFGSIANDTTILIEVCGTPEWSNCPVKCDTTAITYNINPIVSTISDTSLCQGDTMTLSGYGADSYQWDNFVVDGIEFIVYDTLTYTVVGSTSAGCKDTASVTLNVHQMDLDAGTYPDLCTGDTLTLIATGADIFSWDHGAVNGVPFVPSTAGVYYVTGTDTLFGCSYTSGTSITINLNPNITIFGIKNVCKGDSVLMYGGGGGTISYSWTGGIVDSVPFYPDSTNTYVVTGTNVDGCKDIDTITIEVYSLPDVPVITQTGDTLVSDSVKAYTWYLNDSIVGNGLGTPSWIAQTSGVYMLEVRDSNACSNFSDTVYVEVTVDTTEGIAEFKSDFMEVYPNPNTGRFIVKINRKIEGFIEVYNSTGELIESVPVSGDLTKIDLNLNEQVNGIYFIHLKGRSNFSVEKVNVQR